MKSFRRVCAIGGACLGLSTACAGDGPRDDASGAVSESDLASVNVSLSATLAHDVVSVHFLVALEGNSCDQAIAGVIVPVAVSSAQGVHAAAAATFPVPPGRYLVCARPLTAAGVPSAECSAASGVTSVAPGSRAELVLVSTCGTTPNGSVDLTTVLNDPPTIVRVDGEANFVTTCSTLHLAAIATDPNDDAIAIDWLVTSGAAWLTNNGAGATFGPAPAGDYEVTVGATDEYGARTTFTFPIHVTDDPSCVPRPPNLAAVTQLYCADSCGAWGGGDGCQQEDADALCRIRTNNPKAVATSFRIALAQHGAGICCPDTSANTQGCVDVGVLSATGTNLTVSVHPNDLLASQGPGNVVTDVVCSPGGSDGTCASISVDASARTVQAARFFLDFSNGVASDPEELDVLEWAGGSNLTQSGFDATDSCFFGDVEYFGNGWAPPDPQSGGSVLVGSGSTGSWEEDGSSVLIHSVSTGCMPSAAVPVETRYRFRDGAGADTIELERQFDFGTVPFDHAFRPFIPRLRADFDEVLHPDLTGGELVTEAFGVGGELSNWNGSWLAYYASSGPHMGQGMIVLRAPSPFAVHLWIDSDDFSRTNASSALLLPPAGGFHGPLTERELLCFFDAGSWSSADQAALELPPGCELDLACRGAAGEN